MTWSLLSFILTVAGLIQAFYKIDNVTLEEHLQKVQKYKKRAVYMLCAAVAVSLGSDVYDHHQSALKDEENKKSIKTIDSISSTSKTLNSLLGSANHKIDSLNGVILLTKKDIEDTVKVCGLNTNN